MRNKVVLVIGLVLACTSTLQAQKVKLQRDAQRPIVKVSIAGKHFTDFFFPDTIAKPVLYPIKS
jgi:hypothetical protein